MTATEVYANDALATVTSGGTTAPSSGTVESWTVSITQAFPTASTGVTQFHIADTATGYTTEKILVTNGSGSTGTQTWSVTRGAEGSSTVAHVGGFTIRQVVTAGVFGTYALDYNVTDWVNAVEQYSADPTGSSDSTTAIQNALNSVGPLNTSGALGGTVYLPAGTYKTTAPIVVPPYVTLRGVMSYQSGPNGSGANTGQVYGTVLQPASSFAQGGAAANAVLLMLGEHSGGYSHASGGQRITGLSIDGGKWTTTGGPSAIAGYGQVNWATLEDIFIQWAPNYGVANYSDSSDSGDPYPDSWRIKRVHMRGPYNHGFYLNHLQDTELYDCLVLGGTQAISGGSIGDGYYIEYSSVQLVGCRSEYVAGYGFHILENPAGTGAGQVMLTSCSSDHATKDAVFVDGPGSSSSTLNQSVSIANLWVTGAGNNGSTGTGYAAVHVSGATFPVVLSGLQLYAETDSASIHPQYGLLVANSDYVNVSNSIITGGLTAVEDGGGNTDFFTGPNVVTGTGTQTAVTWAAPAPLSVPQGGLGLAALGTAGQSPVVNAAGTALVYETAPVDWANVVTVEGADPTGSANATAKIQAALNAVASNGGGVCYLPQGTYKVGNLTLDSYVELRGASQGTVLSAASGTTGYVLALTTPASSQRTIIRNLEINCNSLSQCGGIKLDNTGFGTSIDPIHTIEDVVILDAGGDGVHLDNSMREVRLSRVYVHYTGMAVGGGAGGAGYGFFLGPGCTDSRFNSCSVGPSGLNGWEIQGNNNLLVQCKTFWAGFTTSWGTTQSGFHLNAVGYVSLTACGAQQSALHGIFLDGAFNCAVIGNESDTNGAGVASGAYGILVNASTDCAVIGNVGENNGILSPGTQQYGLGVEGTNTGTWIAMNGITGSLANFNYISGFGYALLDVSIADLSELTSLNLPATLTFNGAAALPMTEGGAGPMGYITERMLTV